MRSLTGWKDRFPKIPQRAVAWCIPANIENMLRYVGIPTITQEDLILGYCRKFGEEALWKILSLSPLQVLPISTKDLSDHAIIELAKQSAFRHGNFNTFAEPARQNPAFQKAKLALDFRGNIKSNADYFAAITEAVKADCPILISVDNGNHTFHIQSVVEVEADKFKAYDPALNKIEEYSLPKCVFSNDMLVLRRLQ